MFVERIDQIDRLMTLPQVVFQINELVESKTSSAADLHRVIKADPALSARLLKLVNSAYYGLPGQVASLEKAVILLGVTAVKNLAIAASIEQIYKRIKLAGPFSGRDLWVHCLAVAAAARSLGQRINMSRLDEVFMAGLMHDLGLLAAAQTEPHDFAQVIHVCTTSQQRWQAAELEILGIEHGAAGARLAEKWHFPPDMIGLLVSHHTWDRTPGRSGDMSRIIFLADTLACHLTEGFNLTACHQTTEPEMLSDTGLTEQDLMEVWQNLPANVENLESILHV